MKLKNFFVLSGRTIMGVLTFSLIGVVTSCSSENAPVIPDDLSQPITFTTNINNDGVSTRAYDDTWEANDAVGIFMHDANGKLSAAHHKANKRYKIESYATDKWKLVPFDNDNNLYYPVNGSDVRFTAYYPYKDLTNQAYGTETAGVDANKTPGVYLVSLGDQSSTKDFDLLYHKGSKNYSKTVPFNVNDGMEFKHQLSKVIVKIKLDTDMTGATISDMAITIKNIPTSATFDLAAGALSNLSAKDDVSTTNNVTIPKADSDDKVVRIHEAIIVPHGVTNKNEYSGRTITIAFNDPDNIPVTLTYNIPDDDYKVFSPKKKTIYVFTLSRKTITVENVTVVDWAKEGDDIEKDLY